MKCTIPEISWHNREPVLSLHIQPVSEKFYRLATGGADCHVLIWQLIINENGAVKIEALSDLTRHQRAVNSVRWAPGGEYLATADDDANIIIWQLKTDNIPSLEGETNDKETWTVYKIMRGHKEDIYDLCWSPNGSKILSGSIDNTAIVWDFIKGKNDHILSDHKGFVQGVAWDPKGHYLATISTDRICRIFDNSGKQVKARIQKGQLPVAQDHYLHNKEVKYFHDDTFKSFFRRLDFSPDGTLLAVPSGHLEIEDCKKILNCALIFAVDLWTSPIAVLPSGKQCSTVARFCPLLFELHDKGPDPIISLPFRMILAVGTDHDIILYDTQQMAPFAYFKDIHYTRLTDLTWSHDGLLLVASSTDGFCALITFELDELGTQYIKEESEAEESLLDISGCEELEKEEAVDVMKPKKPNLLEKWTIKTPKKNEQETVTSTNIGTTRKERNSVIVVEDDTEIGKRKCDDEPKVVPKRIKPLKVVEEKKQDKQNEQNEQESKKRIQPMPIIEIEKGNENDMNTSKIKKRVNPVLPDRNKESGQKNKNFTTGAKWKIKPVIDKNESKLMEKDSLLENEKKKKSISIDDTKNNENPTLKKSSVKKESPKVTPLLSFLKGTSKTKKDSPKTKMNTIAPPIAIIDLDEIEARDAWKCGKEESQVIENKIEHTEDHTEDFSLHLDNTNSQSKDTSSQLQNNKQDLTDDRTHTCDQKQSNGSCNESNLRHEPTKIDLKQNESEVTLLENSTGYKSENCVQSEGDIKKDNTNKFEKTEDLKSVTNVEEKPKRRIPLITLSSPKHKKK